MALNDDQKTMAMGGGGCCCVGWIIFFIVLGTSVKNVRENQQVVFITNTGKTVENGPFTRLIWPSTRHEMRDAVRISQKEYAVLKHERNQKLRHQPGAALVFMDAYETLVEIKEKVVLQKREYIRLKHKLTGMERVAGGPMILVPEPNEESPAGVETCIVVGFTNAILVQNVSSGYKRLVTSKGMYVPAPYEYIIQEQEATLLEPMMYATVKDDLTGVIRNEEGPKLLQLSPAERLLNVSNKVVLEKDSYLRLVDKNTGIERVERGPSLVVPGPNEIAPDGKKQAVFLNSQTAVRVLNRQTGQQRLEDSSGVFFPLPYEQVLEVQTKIRVLPHQAAVTRDIHGNVTLISGAEGARAFFLQPYTSLQTFRWSAYTSPDIVEPVPKVELEMIDLRAQKMFFMSEVRTSDNVKLKLQGTIFWQVKDVLQMVSMTSDVPGDISQRAKSALNQAVSKSTLQTFMRSFNNITQEAFAAQASDSFYTERGVELQSIELTSYDSVDDETALVLQDIIKETTMRINELQKQKSQNDVNAAKLLANINLEKQRTELIQTQADNQKLEKQFKGQSDGAKLVQSAAVFIDGLNESVPNVTERIELYKLHHVMKSRNKDTENLAKGKAKLFLTPDDINLKLNSEL
eukprot:gb/GFBE01052761.1/.p1 GENE.gb/GFBE01052761.1/~~gb/GFBE01052761.1/.p1  ORF type:complete len:632 (+),score=178.25 gb/GFBE01052761.1/:1-1896(+)